MQTVGHVPDFSMYCHNIRMSFQPSRTWFGGDVTVLVPTDDTPVGECLCPYGYYFDEKLNARCYFD